jgi:DNA helicase TIP49 (TBP-interacting protein)
MGKVAGAVKCRSLERAMEQALKVVIFNKINRKVAKIRGSGIRILS